MGVVGGIGGQRGDQLRHEGVFVGLEQGLVVRALLGDAPVIASAAGAGRAEAAEAVGGVDHSIVRQQRGEVARRAVLGVGEFAGACRVDEVGAPDRAVKQTTPR